MAFDVAFAAHFKGVYADAKQIADELLHAESRAAEWRGGDAYLVEIADYH